MNVLTELYKTFEVEPGRLRHIMASIAETVEGSFLADSSKVTKNELNRRSEMCAAIFMELYTDAHWGTIRIIDELPKALRCKLDGIPWEPTREGKGSWGADNARDLIWLPE